MTKGRKKLPTRVKVMTGTYRKDRNNAAEPDYISQIQLPDPPGYLSEIGKDEYYSTASELLALGILSKVSFKLFIGYCTQVAIYFDAIEKVHKTGTVIISKSEDPKVNPYVRVANDALGLMIRLAVEFGITPASSSKVSVKENKEDAKASLIKRLQKR